MLRIIPLTAEYVEATPVPVVLIFGELPRVGSRQPKRAMRLHRGQHPRPTAGARLP